MSRRFILGGLFVLCFFFASLVQALEPRKIGLILDEPAVVPMRVEADIVAQITQEIVADSSIRYELTLLVPGETGIVARSNEKVQLDAFDVVAIYQGDVISQETDLFSAPVVDELNAYLLSNPEHGVVLLGGAAALFERLGFGKNLRTPCLTFGEDRAQAGLIPINQDAVAFDGVEFDRGVAWITNAAFPAFESFTVECDSKVAFLARAPAEGRNIPFLVGLLDSDGETRAKVFAFAWRVSPLFDSAPETYKNNFKRLFANMLDNSGNFVDDSDFTPPTYVAPDFEPLQRALDAFAENYGEEEYPRGAEYAARLAALRERSDKLQKFASSPEYEPERLAVDAETLRQEYAELRKAALLDSPELDFDSFFFIRRDPSQMGLPENFNSNSVIPPTGYKNELCRFNFRSGETTVVYKPAYGEFVGDLELYYDCSKMMFSAPDVNADNRWRLWELALNENGDAAQKNPDVKPLINELDVDNYDGCYLPDDRVIFCSTANMTGVPCINGSGHVCNLYLKDRDGSIRQLTLEQDHDWNPVVMNNGRVMYLRWEYVDLPHAFSRIMFHMNPDGTNQSELYGSGSYWPNSIFYARPIPGDSAKFVGIVAGHHDLNRMGDLVIFDPAKGRKETSGVVQRIPGYGKKVEPIACDLPITQDWPKFLHPFPISDTLFLVSCKRNAQAPWEICLADVYDNIAPLVSEQEYAALEPIPFRETERQPVLPDRVDLSSPTADVFIADIYEGEGLKGTPRGEVKALRVFSYQFAYQGMGAEPYSVGLDGPWDPRRIIGTVPVNPDGSAFFKIPAYTPVAFQPLDKDGKAIQIMRSWITALPGEVASCVGCHEPQNSTSSTNPRAIAAQSIPVNIEPFYGPTRGFGFEREIQPILDRYCVECHCKDSPKVAQMIEAGKVSPDVLLSVKRPGETFELSLLPDFRKSDPVVALDNPNYIALASPFSNAYYQLRRFVRTATKESQMPVHRPYEFYADTTELFQLLERGHYEVELDPESWAKLITWVDLNAPYNGSWGEMIRDNQELVKKQFARREELRKLYAPGSEQLDDDPNVVPSVAPVKESNLRVRNSYILTSVDNVENLPKTSPDIEKFETIEVPLSDETSLKLKRIPGLNYSVGQFEITNEQYRLFDPTFDAGIEYGDFIQFSPGERGWLLSRKNQPVARVTWKNAVDFCAWLSEKTGDEYRLPTQEEWNYLARGGDLNAKDFWFGPLGTDYAQFENLADSTHGKISPFGWTGRVETLPGWRPVDWDVDDYSRVSAPVGSYKPNRFDLYDMQGNVAEWTNSELQSKRTIVDSETNQIISETTTVKKIICGGSWLRPARFSTFDSFRMFPEHYSLRDVGFRVVRVEKK